MSRNNDLEEFDGVSKFRRIFLVIIAVFLIFAGPTYVSYLLSDVLNVNYLVSIVSGFSLFVAGLLLIWFLARRKIIR